MLLNFKKVIVASLLCIGLCLIFIPTLKKNKLKNTINPDIVKHFKLTEHTINTLANKEELIKWLDEEEKNVWNELEKTIHLSFQECQNLKQHKRNEYYDDLAILEENYVTPELPSQDTTNFIQSIMKEFNIDPQHLSVVGCNHGSAAAATDEFIMIDEQLLNTFTEKAKKFVIGHELVHFLNQDHSTNFFVKKFAKKVNLPMDDENNPVNKLFQFQELRADIISSLHGNEYAQGSIEFFNKHINAYGKKSGPPCHPQSYVRLELGTKIAHILKNVSQSI